MIGVTKRQRKRNMLYIQFTIEVGVWGRNSKVLCRKGIKSHTNITSSFFQLAHKYTYIKMYNTVQYKTLRTHSRSVCMVYILHRHTTQNVHARTYFTTRVAVYLFIHASTLRMLYIRMKSTFLFYGLLCVHTQCGRVSHLKFHLFSFLDLSLLRCLFSAPNLIFLSKWFSLSMSALHIFQLKSSLEMVAYFFGATLTARLHVLALVHPLINFETSNRIVNCEQWNIQYTCSHGQLRI